MKQNQQPLSSIPLNNNDSDFLCLFLRQLISSVGSVPVCCVGVLGFQASDQTNTQGLKGEFAAL